MITARTSSSGRETNTRFQHLEPSENVKQPSPVAGGIQLTKRRVLILSEIIAPYRIPVFNALARHDDIDLHVVFLAETDDALRQWPVYKDEIHFSHEVLPSWRFRAGKFNLLLNWRLRSRLKQFAPQAIICGGYNYFASWEALSWARRHHVDFILWSESNRHDVRGGHYFVESLKTYFLGRCDRFVVPGQASREYLESLGVRAQAIALAPNAVDNLQFQFRADRIRPQAHDLRKKLFLPDRFILFVGRLVPEKGVFDLLEAYSRLDADLRSKVGLVFAGDGPSRAELERQAAQISSGSISFPGFLHREELAGLYALAEALILPTHSDTWGLVVNEAMACGLPIVVSAVAGCAIDLVEDGWNGYVVPPRNPARLSVAIDSVLQNPELRQLMRFRSAQRIQSYSPDACAHGLAAIAMPPGREAR